jgi:hypothetical protein
LRKRMCIELAPGGRVRLTDLDTLEELATGME